MSWPVVIPSSHWVDSLVFICGQPLKSCFFHIDLFMLSDSAQMLWDVFGGVALHNVPPLSF